MKRSLLHLTAYAALAGIVAASGVQANQAPAPRASGESAERMFQRFDRNADGQITRPEAREALTERFSRMDTDRNGSVTGAERKATRKARQFRQMDANGDGRVSLAEMEAATMKRVQSRFARMDRDGDGVLTLVEVQSQAKRGAGRGPMTLQDLDARVMRMFDRADQNRDGVITPDEANLMRRHGQRS